MNETTAKHRKAAVMQTIVVITETPCGVFEDEFEIEDDAAEQEIEECAKDAFSNRCSYGWHRKEDQDA